ncbi:hypothetical protein BD626DRAFT_441338 [Schizophyllum amplum]|uniref:BTB domain-containing protein n=1 Tax=Schizophyllum amplum TaxID=97359 RepID=A0A550BUH2_9AGAR|nr:hypothetical protein BD626DRAFT_441338 [Auriculariopsis ampla]
MTVPLCKVGDLWFPDGNLLIRVGDRVCRVYQGFLASQSPVMGDMFSFPQPSEGADMVEGVPAVRLPDPPEEVTHWLRAMLLPWTFPGYPNYTEIDQLLAVLRLSHKYDVQYLRRRALEHFAALLPVDVDNVKANAHHFKSRNISHECPLSVYLRINSIAHEVGALWLIPCIIYELHQFMYDDPCALDNISTESPPLTTQLLIRLYKISHLITQQFCLAHLVRHVADCGQRQPCGAERRVTRSDWDEELHKDPVCFYSGLDEIAEDGKSVACLGRGFEDTQNLCYSCRLDMRARHLHACKIFWNALPKSLGLPMWKDLLATKASDLGDDMKT